MPNQFQYLTKYEDWIKYYSIAGVVELADTLRSGRSEHSARESSNLSFGTNATKSVAFFYAFLSAPGGCRGGTIVATESGI